MSETQTVASSIISFKTEMIDLGTLGTLRVRRPTVNPKRLRRRILHGIAHTFQDLMTRTDVYGLENIPAKGPLLILPNHVSNLDGILVLANFPRQIEMVGPGDFKMITLKDYMLRAYGVTRTNRGHADTNSLKAMVAHLKAGRDLLMFPTGGMWEKRRFEAKDGAAYLSQLTGARILPVGLSGTYLKSIDAFMGLQPRITVRFGKVMPAVSPSRNRREREADLESANREIMARIWDLMEPAEQRQYAQWEHEVYEMQIALERFDDHEPVRYDGPALPEMSTLAEFVAKPNLFRPMWENAGLLLDPFREDRFFAPIEVKMAANDLRELLQGSYARYIPYRLGDEAQEQVIAALRGLADLAEWAMRHEVKVRLKPVSVDPAASN